jgi:hypothetical protein
MAKCLISGVETNFKWKNKPLDRWFVNKAKEFKKEFPDLTTREILIKLQNQWREELNEYKKKKAEGINRNPPT